MLFMIINIWPLSLKVYYSYLLGQYSKPHYDANSPESSFNHTNKM